ncbi:MAG: HesA/MoeB/ThiF family protein [Methanobacteriota archaeon]
MMNLERYRRQTLVPELGTQGQETLTKKHTIIIGGGGLGSNSANILIRTGIGHLSIIDDDLVDLTNLHRTAVFTEEDIGEPKAMVLEKRLKQVNTESTIHGITKKLMKDNISTLLKGADILVDGTDNLETRFLLNDYAVHNHIPWVYAGVYGTIGMVMSIIPKKTPCLHCICHVLPTPTNQENPVLGNIPVTIASIQTTEVIKILLNRAPSGLLIYDGWNHTLEELRIEQNPSCICCKS